MSVEGEFLEWRDEWKGSAAETCAWRVNAELFDLCRERMPGHTDLGETFTKVLVVGRTFLTQMEKHLEKSDERFVDGPHLLAKKLHECGRSVEEIISRANSIKDPCSEEGAEAIVSCVENFHNLIEPVRKKNSSSRIKMTSFCSKYLHCHAKRIYIFDLNARMAVNYFCKGRNIDAGDLDRLEVEFAET